MAITIKLDGFDAAKSAISKLKTAAPSNLADAVLESAININTQAKQNIAVDTGITRSEVIFNITDNGMTAEVGTNNKNGTYLEYGTQPHFPPVEPLEEWAQRHGMPKGTGFLIARKISERGTPERPWLMPAYEGERENFLANIAKAVLDAANEAAS